MKTLAALALLLATMLSIPRAVVAQDVSPLDQEKLKQAGIAADRFIERFRQTRDFGTAWKQFQMSDISCVIKTNGFFSEEDYRRLKFKDELLQRFYVEVMNYFYLRNIYDLSVASMDSKLSEEEITPREIRVMESKATYVKTNGREPDSAKEVEEMIVELRRSARLYLKYMPRNAMKSVAWRKNSASLIRQVPDSE
ncbi:MAG TPA: hypothetical protein VFR12_01105, partial [Pyrinomonadaceae bacterium]|nr:hypothetical protein [Pyrinomonadaceae bacterium]